jgi:hypothetical protein
MDSGQLFLWVGRRTRRVRECGPSSRDARSARTQWVRLRRQALLAWRADAECLDAISRLVPGDGPDEFVAVSIIGGVHDECRCGLCAGHLLVVELELVTEHPLEIGDGASDVHADVEAKWSPVWAL